ncbi:Uncharacterized protein DAT39_007353 [Clarias magur]|uniref:Uncharacterized protein n=1 Tax=Clarias magur TaxID=1594786 RepID=A0A8J4UTC6_CLAMG|nr:Uncharacterized protein DAT39_007353 [Clarias magur]
MAPWGRRAEQSIGSHQERGHGLSRRLANVNSLYRIPFKTGSYMSCRSESSPECSRLHRNRRS